MPFSKRGIEKAFKDLPDTFKLTVNLLPVGRTVEIPHTHIKDFILYYRSLQRKKVIYPIGYRQPQKVIFKRLYINDKLHEWLIDKGVLYENK